jgi:hypothetical protein
MSLPPLPKFDLFSEGVPIYDKQTTAEYGRQCWNAAIDAAVELFTYKASNGHRYISFIDGAPLDDEVEELKIPASTVSQEP